MCLLSLLTQQVSRLQGSSWGAEVHGIDLKEDVPKDLQESIKQAVSEHRVVVFRDQGIVSGEVRQTNHREATFQPESHPFIHYWP